MRSDPPTAIPTLRGRIVHVLWRNLPRLVLLVLVLLCLVLYFAIRKERATIAADKAAAISKETPSINGVTLLLSPTAISDRINLPGVIEPWVDLQLLARIQGTVVEVLASEGDHVEKGDVLARIEEADYRIALDRARAAFNQARADLERDATIHTKGVLPTAELETRRTHLATAKADLEEAELRYSRCTIVAPMSGVIKTLDAKVGLLLSVGDPVARILQIDQVKGVIGIPESDVSEVRDLPTVELTIQAVGEGKITGRNHFFSPAPDSTARLYQLELAIDNRDGRILPGMFIRANIVKKTVHDVIVAPFYSIISRNDQQFVFVEKDGIVEKRSVTMGIMDGWMVEITSGLAAGDHLVVEGQRDLENGQRLNVIRQLTAPGKTPL
ncbi:MAG: efflux RND transporter periplasmic adaptor subunit [Desulfopila sp.]